MRIIFVKLSELVISNLVIYDWFYLLTNRGVQIFTPSFFILAYIVPAHSWIDLYLNKPESTIHVLYHGTLNTLISRRTLVYLVNFIACIHNWIILPCHYLICIEIILNNVNKPGFRGSLSKLHDTLRFPTSIHLFICINIPGFGGPWIICMFPWDFPPALFISFHVLPLEGSFDHINWYIDSFGVDTSNHMFS